MSTRLRPLSAALLACLLLLGPANAAGAEGTGGEGRILGISAPADCRVTVDGVSLSPDDAVSASAGIPAGFEAYTDGAACERLLYSVEGQGAEPVVSVRGPGGRELEALTTDGRLLHFFPGDPAAEEELRPVAEKFFTAYMTYACHPFDLTRQYNVLKLTLASSRLYSYLSDSQPAMIWAAHTDLDIERLNYGNFSYVGERCFVCTVDFAVNTTASTWQGEQRGRQENAMQLLFVRDESAVWRAAAMSLLPPLPPTETADGPALELLEINEGSCKGRLLIVRDPKRLILGTSENFGREPGLTLSDMAAKYDAVAGINAGGFNDENGRGNGSLPQGLVIKEGELIWGEDKGVYNMVGLDRDGVLRVGAMSGAEALEKGIQWGVSFVTYDGLSSTLVVNGERQNAKPGGGVNPRTAIGQREDGAILLLVLDGRGISSLGATIEDICDIMLKHGAVTVGNLDGGSSSAMVYGGALINNCASVVGPRRMPTAFLVMKEDQ